MEKASSEVQVCSRRPFVLRLEFCSSFAGRSGGGAGKVDLGQCPDSGFPGVSRAATLRSAGLRFDGEQGRGYSLQGTA